MNQDFFELSSPKDMLNKAKRDFTKMRGNLNTDNIFNFFVTTYHIMDYVKVAMGCSKEREKWPKPIQEMYEDEDFSMCQFICDKGKHLKLDNPKLEKLSKTAQMKHKPGAEVGAFELNTTELNEPPSNNLLVDGKEVDIIALGERILERWESLLKKNGIS